MKIKIKRVYEKPDKEDGLRILVDRLWPRGFVSFPESWPFKCVIKTRQEIRQVL